MLNSVKKSVGVLLVTTMNDLSQEKLADPYFMLFPAKQFKNFT